MVAGEYSHREPLGHNELKAEQPFNLHAHPHPHCTPSPSLCYPHPYPFSLPHLHPHPIPISKQLAAEMAFMLGDSQNPCQQVLCMTSLLEAFYNSAGWLRKTCS